MFKLPLLRQLKVCFRNESSKHAFDPWHLSRKYVTNQGQVINSILVISLSFLLLVILKGLTNSACADNVYQSLVLLFVHGLVRNVPSFSKGAVRYPRQVDS